MLFCGFLSSCMLFFFLLFNGNGFDMCNRVVLILLPALSLPAFILYFVICGIPIWLLYKGNSWLTLAGYLYLISSMLLIAMLLIFLYDWNPVTANMRPENIPVDEGTYFTYNELTVIICIIWATLLIVPVLITSYLAKRWVVKKPSVGIEHKDSRLDGSF